MGKKKETKQHKQRVKVREALLGRRENRPQTPLARVSRG